MSEKTIEIIVPDEIREEWSKNGVFSYCIWALRSIISSWNYTGNLKPLGNISIMSITESLTWLWLTNNNEFYYYKRKMFEEENIDLLPVNSDSKRGHLFLKEDLAELRAFIINCRERKNKK